MSNVLVTGCNGFIGSRVTQTLLKEGYNVLGISMEEKSHLNHPSFRYISANITDCISIERIFQENDISMVIHLAAIAHTQKGQKVDWNTYYRVNTLASKTIFECADRVNADVFFASTVDVYGACEDSILTEELVPRPISDYGISKYQAENILMEIAKYSDSNHIIARFAPVYAKEFMKDAYKRIYVKYPKIGFVIGEGYKYQLLSVNNICDFVISWIKSDKKFRGIVNVTDSESIDSREFISLERKIGNVRKVIRIPQLLISFIISTIDSIYKKTKNNKLLKVRTTLYKLINPNKYSIDKMKKLTIQKWNLVTTVYDSRD
jgi:nucleoside-diphosphate-sugar epimerase